MALVLSLLSVIGVGVFHIGFGLKSVGLPLFVWAICAASLFFGERAGRLAAAAGVVMVWTIYLLGEAGFIAMPSQSHQGSVFSSVISLSLMLVLVYLIISAFESRSAKARRNLLDESHRLSARNQFFAAISHEFRTPLNGIHTAVTLLENPRSRPESHPRYFKAIRNSIESLSGIINDILDISRLESGGFQLQEEAVDLKTLCADVIDFFEPLALSKANHLSLEMGAGDDTVVQCDPLRLRQMISNYLSNALKFTSGGEVKLTVEQVGDADDRLWRFAVSDTGCGIEPQCLAGLFKPFTQADNQLAASQQGSGLGLSIVAALARQMDGQVGASSEPGKGSRFWFTVDLASVTDVATNPG